METLLFVVLITIWWYSGYWSFKYWYTHDWYFTTRVIPLACFAGTIGPLAFCLGYLIHGNSTNRERIVTDKRNNIPNSC